MVTRDDVLAARETIAGRVHRTPTLTSASLAREAGVPVHLKAELFQRTGSFKPRGVLNKLGSLSPDEKARGVIGISAGNHAQALAYAATLEGVDELAVMWQGANAVAICTGRVELVLVSEAEIEAGFRFLYGRAKLACEPAGAAGVAALLAGKVPIEGSKGVAIVVSGGNVAAETAVAILAGR